jgi:PAS domain S-box-containing protein
MGMRPDGTIVFFADSEPPGSGDYSPPGQEYPEASETLVDSFVSHTEATEGPVADRWGTWVSGLVPLTSERSGEVIAVFGMDVDAREWNTRIMFASFPAVIGTLLVILILLIFTDIHRRDRRERQILETSERALRESERRLNDIIDFLPDPTFVIDLNGRVILWNRAIEEMTGTPAGEMLGRGNHEYALPFYGTRRPMLIDLIFEPDEVIGRTYSHIIHEKGVLIADTSLPRPKGQTLTLMGKASPLYNQQGEIVGAIESIRDVTFRKAAEEAIRKSEERYRLLLQNVNDGIIVHEVSSEGPGRILDVNDRACQMLGYSREELVGLSIRDLDVPEQSENISRIAQEVFLKKHAIFRTEYIRKDRSRIPVEISPRLFELQDRSVVLAVVRDITERTRAEQEMARYTAELKQSAEALQRTNSKLSLMNSITRHDILNQVTVITGYLDLMRTADPDPSLKNYIDPALLASDNIKNYIRFSREYQEIGVLSPRWFRVRDLIASAAAGLTLAPITLAVDTGELEIFADPLLEKVFYTLLENALRHGETVTAIRFSCHRQDGDLVIACDDDGKGVPPEYKDRIFDRGYYRHTGYGLFLSREILAITGITIRETGVHLKGARFEIVVPEGAYRFAG